MKEIYAIILRFIKRESHVTVHNSLLLLESNIDLFILELNDSSPSLNVKESERIGQGKAMLLTCPPQNFINIKSAFYGQKGDGNSNNGSETIPHCEGTNVLEKVKEW